jgi:hypothetical protein
MTPERHHQIRACYEAALGLEPAAREVFLDRECHGDEPRPGSEPPPICPQARTSWNNIPGWRSGFRLTEKGQSRRRLRANSRDRLG